MLQGSLSISRVGHDLECILSIRNILDDIQHGPAWEECIQQEVQEEVQQGVDCMHEEVDHIHHQMGTLPLMKHIMIKCTIHHQIWLLCGSGDYIPLPIINKYCPKSLKAFCFWQNCSVQSLSVTLVPNIISFKVQREAERVSSYISLQCIIRSYRFLIVYSSFQMQFRFRKFGYNLIQSWWVEALGEIPTGHDASLLISSCRNSEGTNCAWIH